MSQKQHKRIRQQQRRRDIDRDEAILDFLQDLDSLVVTPGGQVVTSLQWVSHFLKQMPPSKIQQLNALIQASPNYSPDQALKASSLLKRFECQQEILPLSRQHLLNISAKPTIDSDVLRSERSEARSAAPIDVVAP